MSLSQESATLEADGPEAEAVDGRVLRGQRNREAIVDAMVAEYEKGNLRPTAAQVAQAAGLSTRSVYHHFDDMTSLIYEVSARTEQRIAELDHDALDGAPLADRVSAFVDHRMDRWSTTAAVVRAGLLAEYDSPVVAEILKHGREKRVSEIRSVFAEEIAADDDGEALSAALDVVFGFDTFHRLTVIRRLSAKRARATIEQMALGVLTA